MKILIVKTSSLGDVIHCLPVINDIRNAYPDAQIDWIVEESFADILSMQPVINQVYTVAFRRWRKQLLDPKTWLEIKQLKHLIGINNYDAVIDTQGLLKSALVTRLVNGTKHGFNKQSIREPIASYFYDKTYAISYQQHAVSRNRALVALSLGYVPPVNVPDYGLKATNNLINHADLVNYLSEPFVIILHGTSRDSKLWPTKHWINLGSALHNQQINLLVPWSNAAELARAKEIANGLKNAIVLPKLSIAELASIFNHAKAVIGVDTGLSHLAASLNIPTIAIYTDTNPLLTGVMGSRARAINLGNIGEIPNVKTVLMHLNQIQ